MATLFLLGVYLGKVAKESGWLYGVATLTMGVLTAIIPCCSTVNERLTWKSLA
jgi:VIT1/CCC1 family predicted Fe2+/Mn2+ transporter